MSEGTEYRVILAPEGLSLEEASETREFTFTTDAPREEVRSRAREHIRSEGLIDPWALRKYWHVASVHRAGDSETLLRQAIFDTVPAASPPTAVSKSFTTVSFRLREPDSKDFQQVEFTALDTLARQFEDFRDSHPALASDEAYLKAAASISPDLYTNFYSNSLIAQEDFLKVLLNNDSEVTDKVSNRSWP